MKDSSEHYLSNNSTNTEKLQSRKGNIQSDLLLLLAAVGLGLLGLWLSNYLFTPNVNSELPALVSEDVTQIKKRMEKYAQNQEQLEAEIENLAYRIEKLEKKQANMSVAPNSLNGIPNINQTIPQTGIEDDISKAEAFLANNQSWSNDIESLLLRLETHYSQKGLSKHLNIKLRSSMNKLYDRYINYILSVMASDPNTAVNKIKQLLGKNNTIAPPKNYTLSPEQRMRINGLAQALSTTR